MSCAQVLCTIILSVVTIGILIFSATIFEFDIEKNVPVLHNVRSKAENLWYSVKGKWRERLPPAMHIAVVTCGADDRVEETLMNLKSAVIFSVKTIKFHIFAEDNLKEKFVANLESWPWKIKTKFDYEIYSITYPDDGKAAEWKKLFKVCASQRLFLPHIMKDIKHILYVDTDILFLSPVDEIWDLFSRFNSTHLAAMSSEHEQTSVAWYTRFARHPYYGETGINSGVMLMDMERVRKARFKNDLQKETLPWQEMLLPLYKKYKFNITWGDQDLLNIVFHYNPELLTTFPCQWNYRPDHCMYMPLCKPASQNGVKILHGCRRAFHLDKWPAFKAVYSAVKSYDFNQDLTTLYETAKANLEATSPTSCQKSSNEMLIGMRNVILSKEEL